MNNAADAHDPPPTLLTVVEVAAMLRVSKMTVYRMIHSNTLSAIKVGHSFRVPRAAVASILDETYADP